jgi:hypothetical protein
MAPLHQVALHLNPNFSTVRPQGRTYGIDRGSRSWTGACWAINKQHTTTLERTYSSTISRARVAQTEQHDIFAPSRYVYSIQNSNISKQTERTTTRAPPPQEICDFALRGDRGIGISFRTPSKKWFIYRSILWIYPDSYQGWVQSSDQLQHCQQILDLALSGDRALGSPLRPHPESDLPTYLYSDSTPIVIMDESDRQISFNILNKSTTSLSVVIRALGFHLGPHPENDLATCLYSGVTSHP